jgi:hypothetical protein
VAGQVSLLASVAIKWQSLASVICFGCQWFCHSKAVNTVKNKIYKVPVPQTNLRRGNLFSFVLFICLLIYKWLQQKNELYETI